MKSFEEIYERSHATEGNGIDDHAVCTATVEELKAFIPHVMSLPYAARVVEVGTYTGRSASVYFQVQKDLNLDIHLIDCLIWNPEHAAKAFFCDLVVTRFNDVPFTYHKMTTDRAVATWTLPIDFLYIDAGHEPPYVDRDFANWTPFVKSGGIMAAHDSQLPAISANLDRYARAANWQLLSEAERMTLWRKP